MTKANAALDALKAQMAAQLVGHHIGPQPLEVYKQKPTNYVYASNGIFRVVPTEIALFVTKVGELAKELTIPGVGRMNEENQLLIPKIPFKYWLQVLSFYKDVHTKDYTEASVVFFWNHDNIELPTNYESGREISGLSQDGQLIIYCPEQKNSSGLSDFTHDTMVPWLRQRCTPLLETHSHHTMGAFWSGTDNANENMTQFYGVYGKIKSNEIEFLFRYVSGEQKLNIDFYQLFERPQLVQTSTLQIEGLDPVVLETTEDAVFKGPWPMVEYPEDWMGQHTKSYSVSTYPKGPAATQGGYQYTPPGARKDERYPGEFNEWKEYEEEWYKTQGLNQGINPGTGRRSTGGATPVGQGARPVQLEEVKKNGAEISKLEGEDVSAIVTDSAYIQMITSQIVDQCDAEDIKKILLELCEYGFDYVITDLVKDQAGYRYNDL